MTRWLPLLLLLAGCITPVRFADRPVVWRVDDERDVPEKPEESEYQAYEYMTEVFVTRRLTRALELRDPHPAESTNAWDEVPDSTWFTNRIGVRHVSLEEAARGPVRGPDPVPPLTIVSGKSGGGNPGFVIEDALDRKFLVKFDTEENPEMQTATDVIVSRILHTAGYNVPADRVFFFCPADLLIGEGAKVKNALLEKEPFTRSRLDEMLGRVHVLPDGCFRALASEYLAGIPLGGATPEGTRPDDPNDTIPHEHRRELRGLRVLSAWLNHTDMKEDNTLDMWVEKDGRHFVRHYLVDFGEALGAHAAEKGRLEDGYEHFWDWRAQPLGLLSLGFWVRPWEYLKSTKWLSIGAFTAEHFDPDGWREAYPYWPFEEADAADHYWGAKLVLRFSRPMLERIVAEGELSDPEAAAYLVDALYERARIIGRTYLEAVTPLDWYRVEDGRLCMVDLGVRFGLANYGLVERVDETGAVLAKRPVAKDGRVCLDLPKDDAYTVLRVRVRRGRNVKKPMQLHVKGGRLLGVIRVEDRL